MAGDGTAEVAWREPEAAPVPITAYEVTPWVGQVAQPSTRFDSTATAQTVTGLTNGTTYTFTVVAINALGNASASSEPSNPVTASRLAVLAGGFAGTQEYVSGNGCSFVHQIFDGSYPGSGNVGTVTVHIEGCTRTDILNYTGTFTISTSVGTVSGTASGPLHFGCFPPGCPAIFVLTLTVTADTDAFAGTTGTLDALIEWAGEDDPNITGTVTVP